MEDKETTLIEWLGGLDGTVTEEVQKARLVELGDMVAAFGSTCSESRVAFRLALSNFIGSLSVDRDFRLIVTNSPKSFPKCLKIYSNNKSVLPGKEENTIESDAKNLIEWIAAFNLPKKNWEVSKESEDRNRDLRIRELAEVFAKSRRPELIYHLQNMVCEMERSVFSRKPHQMALRFQKDVNQLYFWQSCDESKFLSENNPSFDERGVADAVSAKKIKASTGTA